jgi:antitoxin MazE
MLRIIVCRMPPGIIVELCMRSRILLRKAGPQSSLRNNLAIRVPKSVAQQAGQKVKDDLEIKVRKRAHVLKPRLRRIYRLEDMVKRMTPRNVHKQLDFDGPMGREAQ